jgi:hypothetical protein
MKYVLLLIDSLESARCGETPDAPSPEDFIAFDRALEDAGVLAGGFALETVVSTPEGEAEPVVTAGPYAESREFVGGTIIIDVPNLDEALRWARQCPGARGTGRVEVRPMAEY